ncbi:MAG: endonuclease/exonuclease/phosphatase family protein [Acidobacteriota bacterium]|nr:endonuclease/exonuclease/phosphatase family protein [Acidobacteriota bacterium]
MGQRTLKVLSYNIHKGFNLGNTRFVLSEIREALKDIHADMVFLQEVVGDHKVHRRRIDAWPNAAQFEFLADRLWPHHAYGKNAIYEAGHHGNAILSKFPFDTFDNQDISTNPLERRGLLHGVVHIPHTTQRLHAICLHLDLTKRGRTRQVEDLCRRIEQEVPHNEPLVICGDFNDWSLRVTNILKRELDVHEAHYNIHDKHARTFPAVMPMLKLDRIYFRGMVPLRAETLTGTPWRNLSDHAAVFAELAY